MNLSFWGLVSVAVHVCIVVAAFFIVPVNRKPSSATAWLLLVTIAPLVGVIIFILIGSPKLPPRRRQLQRRMSTMIEQLFDQISTEPSVAALLKPPVPASVLPHATLIKRLGGMLPVAGNSVELLPEYDAIIERMAREINQAQRYVHIEFYIIVHDKTTAGFFTAMANAVQRGVTVRLLLDQIGSRKYPGRKQMEAHLTQIGVDWHYMLPVGKPGEWLRLDLRNHRKILIVDGEVAYTGSLNVVTRTYHRKDNISYDELFTRVTGPVVAQFEAVFATDWYSETGELLDPAHYPDLARTAWHATGTSLCQVLPSGPGFEDENNLRLFTGMIHAARRRLLIVTPYFVPDDSLMLAITNAALRGVHVTLINSVVADQVMVAGAQRSYYEQLLLAGVDLQLYNEPILLHAKTIAVDDEMAMIGSSNLDIRSFTLDLEVSLVVYDPAVVSALQRVIEGYLARSTPVHLDTWRKRPATTRLVENIARLTAALQ